MISVCIATHNGEKYIKEQLDSILCQLSTEDEVVISDDGSTDKTIDVILSLRDSRIQLYQYHQTAKGKVSHYYVCKNFENALKQAKGDYIFLADQDDFWMPNKVEKCLAALKTYTLALKRGKYYGCTIAFRKELLKWILPFPSELILHDQWIGCMAELTGNVYYEREPLMKYRWHGNNTSGGASPHSHWFQVKYRLYMFTHLMKRRFQHII